MKNIAFPVLLWLALPAFCWGQFSRQGTITFARKYSMKRAIQLSENNDWAKQFIDQMPESVTTEFTLAFNDRQSCYTFQKEEDLKGFASYMVSSSVAYKNQVWDDFTRHMSVAQKQFYEKTYLIADSMPRFQWKIEDEIRTIAGYSCRKAVTRICDSVVVVAFYTNQIMVTGGPESFNGLPGMILGIAIPRLYTTWFATKVELDPPSGEALAAPSKGSRVTRETFYSDITKAIKDWSKSGAKAIWEITL